MSRQTRRTPLRSKKAMRRFVDRVTEHGKPQPLHVITHEEIRRSGGTCAKVGCFFLYFTGMVFSVVDGRGDMGLDQDEEFYMYQDGKGIHYGKRKRSQDDE